MADGYIKLYRQMQESRMYFEGKFDKTHAWIDLILLANYKGGFICIRGIDVEVKRGQIAKSVSFFAERWHWSKPTVEKFFKNLESCQQISIERNNVTNLITIVNYERYQGEIEDDCQENCQQICQQNCQQTKKFSPCTPLQEENKKEKKDKRKQSNDCFRKKFKGLSFEEKQNLFYNELVEYVRQYPTDMLREFYNYWSEMSSTQSDKMKCETTDSWETSKRLARWFINYNNKKQNIVQQNAKPQQIQF